MAYLFHLGRIWDFADIHLASEVRNCLLLLPWIVSGWNNCVFNGLWFLLSFRSSNARDLTFFAGKAMAVNRQLAEQDGMEDQQQQQEVPFVVTAPGSSMQLSPPSKSKLARRRQQGSQPKGGPVSAAELRQLLAPLVIVGDCAWTFSNLTSDLPEKIQVEILFSLHFRSGPPPQLEQALVPLPFRRFCLAVKGGAPSYSPFLEMPFAPL